MTQPLDDQRWRRVNELFEGASALPEGERSDYLLAQCAGDQLLRDEIESLLWFSPVAENLEGAVSLALGEAAAMVSPEARSLERVGPYRLLNEIGRGGMGRVYLAERDGDDFQQRVAVKVVRGLIGVDGMRRFRAERRILASLEHPCIARLIDGGTTPTGVPYLVMEYVEGLAIDAHCRAAQMSIRDRVALFCRVCDAVSYAHRRLVVHRDLKPSNILVTADGTPKLLDFGIAKLLDENDATDAMLATSPSMRMLTPEYASPEQVRGQTITTSSDVYSLGVLLFGLLSGARPYTFASRSPDEIARVVCEQEPPRPSSQANAETATALRGDLDTIVLAALQKDPHRRYGSVDQLADDLRRYLGGHPVLAQPATWRYLVARFVGRNRAGVAVAALILLLIAGFATALAAYARRAAYERDTAQQITQFMGELFQAVNPAEAQGNTVTVREILDRGAGRIRAQFAARPDLRARLLQEMGAASSSLSVTEPAQELLAESLAVRRASGDTDSLETADTMWRLARSYLQFGGGGRVADAEPLTREALAIRRRRLGPRAPEVADSLNQLGRVIDVQGGRWLDVEPLLQEAIDIWRETIGPDHPRLHSALMQLGLGRQAQGDVAGAEVAVREALRIARLEGEDTPSTAVSKMALAGIFGARGLMGDAEAMYREAVATESKIHGADHIATQTAIGRLGRAIRQQGRLQEAEPVFREVIANWRKRPGAGGPMYEALTDLGALLEDTGRLAEAEACFREAVEVARAKFAPNAPAIADTQHALADHLEVQGRAEEALVLADAVLATRRKQLGEAHPKVAATILVRARALAALGRTTDAEVAFRDATGRMNVAPPEHGAFLLRVGRAGEALPILQAAYQEDAKRLPAAHLARGQSALIYGAALLAAGRRPEGEPLMRSGLAVVEAVLPPGDPRRRDASRWMAGLSQRP